MKNPFSQQNTQSYLVKRQLSKINHQKKSIQKQSSLFYHSQQNQKNKQRQSSLHHKNQYYHQSRRKQQNKNCHININQQYGLTMPYKNNKNHSNNSLSRQRSNSSLSNQSLKRPEYYSSQYCFYNLDNIKSQSNKNNNNQSNYSDHSNFKLPSKYFISSQTKDSTLGQRILSDKWKRQRIQYQSLKTYGAQAAFRLSLNYNTGPNINHFSLSNKEYNYSTKNFDFKQLNYSYDTALFGQSANSFGKNYQNLNQFQKGQTKQTQNQQYQSEIQQQNKKTFANLKNTLQMYSNKRLTKKINSSNTQTEDDFSSMNDDDSIRSRKNSQVRRRSSSKLVEALIGVNSRENLSPFSYQSDFTISQDNFFGSTQIVKKNINKNVKKKNSIFCKTKQQIQKNQIDTIVQNQDLQKSNKRKSSLKKISTSKKLLPLSEKQTSNNNIRESNSSKKSKQRSSFFKTFQEDEL